MPDALILLVEESTAARRAMRLTLEAEDYGVLEADDGASALKLVAERAPALSTARLAPA